MRGRLILDGELVESGSVAVDPLGRGFAYGYGVFETIKFVEGRPCFLAQHLERLRRAAAGLGLGAAADADALRRQVSTLLGSDGNESGVFKIVIFEDGGKARAALFVRSRGLPSERAPLRARVSPVVKASLAFASRHKTLNYLETVREMEDARSHGFDELVYRNEFGFLTECSVSNLFFVADGALRTPRLECGLLDGIVRAQVIELAAERGWRVEEGSFPLEALLEAEEAFVTNSAVGALSIRELDDGEGRLKQFESKLAPQLAAALGERERASREAGA